VVSIYLIFSTVFACHRGLGNEELMGKRIEAQTAVFAGGCFWGIEEGMRRAKGVIETEAGYIGGVTPNPTYEQVKTGTTGHAEAVRVVFDPRRISYRELARLFFEIHDPTQVDRQGPDVGTQYRSAVFYASDFQRDTAAELIDILRRRGYRVATKLEPASRFHPAEEYHQQYAQKSGRSHCAHYTKRF
jgi:peptide methionine sulfoxide reductase msrA/msrB